MSSYSDFAKNFIGYREGGAKHKEIVDTYNKITPLPRGYKVKYSDSWCAVFVSYVLSKCGATKRVYECSANEMRRLCIKQGVYTNNTSNPKKDDIIFYCWGSNGIANHVGFVYKVNDKTITTIEGNKDDKVDTRTINRNNKSIIGYATIPSNTTTKTTKLSNEEIAKRVIQGKYGNGNARKAKLTSLGYDYNTIQKLVNQMLKKK